MFKYEKNEFDDLFPKIRLEEFKKLPIPKCSNDKSISKLSKEISMLKQQEKNTTNLENQIDQLVYQLYELTEEEIAIIEGSNK
ncbi:MAG: hypothetical protein IPH58_18775 [Sphingobacteriales bacterium]|nr:hypothetical protein [Sphingobacteriales bacterium]